MCGIVGFSGAYSKTLLEKMQKVIAFRGPDASGELYLPESKVGLAHRRLSIIDLSADGDQPMWDSTKSVCIIFNGEIYNYLILRQELLQQGFRFHNRTDTEVLLNLYLRDGVDMLAKLNGIFAFAIYDSRNRSLFLARDHLGVKPLYYAESAKGFIFASELKAILQEPTISREINPVAVHNYLRYLWSPSPDTMLRLIKKLSPGFAMIVKDGNIKRQWQYYDLPYNNFIEDFSVSEAVGLFQAKLKTAVERQLISDVPVGAFLSGGLDSSAIVAMVRELDSHRHLDCFTMRFPDKFSKSEGGVEDLPYAKMVAKHLNVNLHVLDAEVDIMSQLEKVLYHLDEPQADPAAINTLLIAGLAKKHGIKVLLSGAGGDDILTGYRRHYALMMEKYWQWLPKCSINALSVLFDKMPLNSSFFMRASKVLARGRLDPQRRIASYFYWLSPELEADIYNEVFKRQLGNIETQDKINLTLRDLQGKTITRLNQMLYLEAKYFLSDHNLNYTDKMCMSEGIEARVPLIDIDLVDFATRLPIHYKQRGKTSKWIFKKAMEPYLPKSVIYRKKTGFGAPLRQWIRQGLRPMIDEVLSEQAIRNRGIFNPKVVRKLIEENQLGRLDVSYPIFAMLSIELWCNLFL